MGILQILSFRSQSKLLVLCKSLSLEFTGVHHQNGIAKKMIVDLTALVRTLLLHASCNWSEAVTPVMLLQFPLKYASYVMDSTL